MTEFIIVLTVLVGWTVDLNYNPREFNEPTSIEVRAEINNEVTTAFLMEAIVGEPENDIRYMFTPLDCGEYMLEITASYSTHDDCRTDHRITHKRTVNSVKALFSDNFESGNCGEWDDSRP